MSIELITLVMVLAALASFALGVPIAFALASIALILTTFLWGSDGLLTIATSALQPLNSFLLVAIPMFIFMGQMLERSGIADDLFEMMYRWVGRIPGGLAIATVVSCAVFAALVGLLGPGTVVMGLVALPAMLKRKYDKRVVIGSIAAGGALGMLIPPSVIMIIYAMISETSIKALFLGGVGPGILLVIMYCLYIGIRCLLQPEMGPRLGIGERFSWPEKLLSLKALILPILLIFMIMGALFSGACTATEASAIGAAGAIVIAAIGRRLTWQNLREACYRTLRLSVMLMWVVIGSIAFSSVYNALGAQQLILQLLEGVQLGPYSVLIGMMLSFFFMGTLLDDLPILMITGPIYIPIIKALGFDPTWFGVLYVINMEMGYLTPPFGLSLFYMKAVVPKGITMADIYRSVGPFIALQAICLVLCMLFPEIIVYLPNLLAEVAK